MQISHQDRNYIIQRGIQRTIEEGTNTYLLFPSEVHRLLGRIEDLRKEQYAVRVRQGYQSCGSYKESLKKDLARLESEIVNTHQELEVVLFPLRDEILRKQTLAQIAKTLLQEIK